MEAYLDRARGALKNFLAAVDAFDRVRAGIAPSAKVPQTTIDKIGDIVRRIREAAQKLRNSIELIAAGTAVDVSDLQERMKDEGTSLAHALKALDEALAKLPAGTPLGATALFDLEEHAERVAAAIFPNAIEGVNDINDTLLSFRPIWQEYTKVLASQLTGTGRKLTSDQIAKVEEAAGRIDAQISRVNQLLNELVVAEVSQSARIDDIIRDARHALKGAVKDASSKAADAYKPFHRVLGQAEKLAGKIDEQFAKLRVPVFPAADRLEEVETLLKPGVYEDLAGAERFALLNITARLRSIKVASDHLLSSRFGIRVFDVFPDRIYFSADASFIEALKELEKKRLFEVAPASLHRFKDGSYKQLDGGKGNLQVSFAKGSDVNPSDASQVRVDADIDLYRSPIKHLFGEVLVNHLTGSKTDQFRVWDILAAKSVIPIGGFDVVSV
jgi:hypothetical protein